MAWHGYFRYAGNEIVNLPRTEAYARESGWFKPSGDGVDLAVMTGAGRYVSPIIDNAPWTDPDEDASYDFWGFYPIDVTGIEDSTVTSTVVENTGDGGTPGRVRRATKTVVFRGLLLAASECGADHGMRWLRSVLNGSACGNQSTQTCNGDDLCYLSCEPALDYNVPGDFIVIPGTPGSPGTLDTYDGGNGEDPNTGSASGGSGGSVGDEVLDGGGAGDPGDAYVFDGGEEPSGLDEFIDGGGASLPPSFNVIDGCNVNLDCAPSGPGTPDIVIDTNVEPQDPAFCLDEMTRSLRKVVFNNGPTILNKQTTTDGSAVWTVQFTAVAGNPYEFGTEKKIVQGFMDPTITNPYLPGVDGIFDLTGVIVDESGCVEPAVSPVFDPFCPALTAPPAVPNVPLGCYTPPANWRRRQFSIPKNYIPLHTDAVPLMKVYARDDEVRNLRLRFYADVNGDGSIVDDPCAWCGDIVISYVPEDLTLVFDGSDKVIYVENPGGLRRRAEHLVYSTDGGPFEWPALTCGFNYIVTLDLPQTQAPPVVDFSLYNRAA